MAQGLNATMVKHHKKAGYLSDSKETGLYLKTTSKGSKSWIYRWRDKFHLDKHGKPKLRDMGLGSVDVVSLSAARDAAREARRLVHADLDPIALREQERLSLKSKAITFGECAEKFIDAKKSEWSNPKHVAQWRNTLKTYAGAINCKQVSAIELTHILEVLEPIWNTKTETANRVRGRIEKILDWAKTRGYREGDNPARWKGNLDAILPSAQKLKGETHHPTMPYKMLPACMAKLRKLSGTGARCLEFTILTAARTKEAINAEWSEIDWEEKLWVIPATKMKAKKPHRVPLSSAAINILEKQYGQDEQYIFPGDKVSSGLSNNTMRKVLIESLGYSYTVHGFRSTFRTWAAEQTNFPREICEACLAHVNKDKVEAAYQHSDFLKKRAALLSQWATYVNTPATKGGKVTPIKKAS